LSVQLTPLRQRMIDDMAIRNMSPLTQKAYVRAVKNFSLHFRRSPDKLTFEDVRANTSGRAWPSHSYSSSQGRQRQVRDAVRAIAGYPRYLAWLQKRERSCGLVGWSVIREQHWWAGPPHQRAARIVTAQWLKHMSWGAFLNKISSLPPLYLTEFTVRRPYILQPNHGGRNVADTF
jgi:hypothetical protein